MELINHYTTRNGDFILKENKSVSGMFAGLEEKLQKLEEKFLKYPRETLFPPNWKALVDNRCPLCGCKLYQMRSRPFLYCKSKKHRTFMLSTHKLKEVLDSKKA